MGARGAARDRPGPANNAEVGALVREGNGADPYAALAALWVLDNRARYPISTAYDRSCADPDGPGCLGSRPQDTGGGSSNGRTADSDSASLGSNPSPPAI